MAPDIEIPQCPSCESSNYFEEKLDKWWVDFPGDTHYECANCGITWLENEELRLS